MKRIFRFFRSMKFGMILLVLVMLCSLAGSLIPQQETDMTYVNAYGPKPAMWLILLGFTDIFHTWYFYALEILLSFNLILCSILRFPGTRKTMERLRQEAAEADIDEPLTTEQLERLKGYFTARHYHTHTEDSYTLYSKNAAGAYGSFLTHLSILFVLLFGSLVLMTPTITDVTVMPGQAITLEDGTILTCESFHIQDSSGKLDYASILHAESADGSQQKTQEIRVNEPLRFGEYKIYQQTYGTAGQVRITNLENGAEDTVLLTDPCFLSIDGQNGIFYDALYPGFIQDDDGNYTLVTNTSGSYPDPVYAIQSISGGMSTSVLAFPGEELTLGSITFAFLSPTEYPGLRIKRVAGWLYGCLYFSFFLMIAALWLCFFQIPICIKVARTGYCVRSTKPSQGFKLELQSALHLKEES